MISSARFVPFATVKGAYEQHANLLFNVRGISLEWSEGRFNPNLTPACVCISSAEPEKQIRRAFTRPLLGCRGSNRKRLKLN